MDKSQSMIPYLIYRFKAIWANIHLYPIDQENAPEEYPKGETGNGYDTSAEEVLPLYAGWYAKSSRLIGNINKVSGRLSIYFGFAVSIDDTMNKFKGRSKFKKMDEE